jgi:hypothetical protein
MACDGNCGGDCKNGLKLDGSLGTGDTALLTLITKDDVEGQREETFEFPYALIDQNMLSKFSLFNLILGYKLIRVPKADKQENA